MVGLITPADRILVASHRGRAGSTICLGLQPAVYINGLQSASPCGGAIGHEGGRH